MSLARRIVPEQFGVSSDYFDELSEIIDAVVREGRYWVFTGAKDGEAAVFRIHLDTDFLYKSSSLPSISATR